MAASKIVIARKSGACFNEFAHPCSIEQGDRVRVTTAFPGDEVLGGYINDGKPLRVRECTWCLERDEARAKEQADG